jgi:hypothetical protein
VKYALIGDRVMHFLFRALQFNYYSISKQMQTVVMELQ